MTIRKAIAAILILMMSVTYTTPVFAVDSTDEEATQPEVIIQEQEEEAAPDGETEPDSPAQVKKGSEEPTELVKDGGGVYCHNVTGNFYLGKAFQVLDLVNSERSKRGKAPLTMDVDLFEAAQIRAAEAAIYFVPSHNRPDGSSCFTVSPKSYGENLAAGQTTAAKVMESWMNSSGHKANILDGDFQSIGIGCFMGTDGHYYWSQVFGLEPADEEAERQTGHVQRTISVDFGSAPPVKFYIGELRDNGVYVGYDTLKGYPGTTKQLMALAGSKSGGWQTIQAVDADTITWRSSDESIVSVDENGLATLNAIGSCTISLYAGEVPRQGGEITINVKHKHNIVKVAKVAPTCQTTGVKAHYECTECGKLFKDKAGKKTVKASKLKLKKIKHQYKKKIIDDNYLKSSAKCTKKAVYYYACKMCDRKGKKTFKYGKTLGHDYQDFKVVKATPKKDGSVVKKCMRCSKNTKKKVIYKVNKISLDKTSVSYMGDGLEAGEFTVTVKNSKKKEISSDNYTVTYSYPEYITDTPGVGFGEVTVTFNEDCAYYTGTVTLKYTITDCPTE